MPDTILGTGDTSVIKSLWPHVGGDRQQMNEQE